jgi:hypothetical protein
MHFMISTTRLISFSHTHGSGIEPLNQMMLTLQSINQHMKNITNQAIITLNNEKILIRK